MSLSPSLVQSILSGDASQSWKEILMYIGEIFSREFSSRNPEIEITNRDREISDLEMLIANSAWELWKELDSIPKTSDTLKEFWKSPFEKKCILILDGLSLREIPYFLKGAKERNYRLKTNITRAEIPPDTNSFAKALGFSARSDLSNNSSKSPFFDGAFTEAAKFPWADCIPLIQSRTNILFWHHYPDVLIHQFGVPGEGLDNLSRKLFFEFLSDDFWKFIDVLTTGRKLVITSDHGYAATGLFPDIKNPDQVQYLKNVFKAQRYSLDSSQSMFNIPPLDLTLFDEQQKIKMILGRIKWKVSGGHPTLNHGGLSLLEMFVPYLEIGKRN